MYTLNCKGKLLLLNTPLIMGIINITPDSFYSKSALADITKVIALADKMLLDGADILDLGGQSTRPGSKRISAAEEADRVLPAIEMIINKYPDAVLSVDTYYSKVAVTAAGAGASIINDISGGEMDEAMLETVGKLKLPYICMHMKGTPETMQQDMVYEDVVQEVLDFFIRKIAACKEAGIIDVIADPGFGFGKTIAHNLNLLKNLSVFKMLEKPILAGISRKGTIYKTLNTTAEEALNGTTVMNTIAVLNGASILRVHDVKEAKECIRLLDAYGKV